MKRLAFLVFFLAASLVLGAQGLELPKVGRGEIIVVHTGHTLSYNPKCLIPDWVAYELKASKLDGDAQRRKSFSPDPSPVLNGYAQAEHYDYTHSGWSRGHMLPAGDSKFSQTVMDESFYMTNVCPMEPSFNNGPWRRLEEKIRKWAVEYGTVYVIAGAIVGNNRHGKVGDSDVVIPDLYYKAVLVPYKGSYLTVAFVMPNEVTDKRKLKEYAFPVDKLEKAIGKTLFYGLPKSAARRIKPYIPLKELGLY